MPNGTYGGVRGGLNSPYSIGENIKGGFLSRPAVFHDVCHALRVFCSEFLSRPSLFHVLSVFCRANYDCSPCVCPAAVRTMENLTQA